jgi:hypothetical protein
MKAPLWPLAATSLSAFGCSHAETPRPVHDAASVAPPLVAAPTTQGKASSSPAPPGSPSPASPGGTPSAPPPRGDASSAPAPRSDAPSPPAEPDAHDFENQLAGVDPSAGVGDASLLARKPGYTTYANGRFGFSLDVPRAFTAMPGPANGDGLQWRLGNQAAMTASGMHWSTDIEGPLCATSSHVTARKETKTSCWATGKRDGFIFWERAVVSRGVLYTLRFQYAESLKATLDPVVTHVNGSWKR